ncbi:auxin-responsive protein IAA32 isoform X3 [Capsella rubella]|uniref:auxin-responsive protein IAA32 isoform X3 n=1 Tax=Capsella rubella TaxID=81985 RepID=UPI000CD57FD9|nr:auxin-responsive protein IAA32 isoform X3 [Capsella rubella]
MSSSFFFLNSSDTLSASASCYKFVSVSSFFSSHFPFSSPVVCRHNQASMDPNTSADFFQESSKLHTFYPKTKGVVAIDLGLSLKTIQHETYLPSGQMIGLDGYAKLIDWSQPGYNSNTLLKSDEIGNQRRGQGYYNNEEESRGKLAYVKVNLDGLVVGRKVCLLSQGSYSSLALQLDDMFDCVRTEAIPE